MAGHYSINRGSNIGVAHQAQYAKEKDLDDVARSLHWLATDLDGADQRYEELNRGGIQSSHDSEDSGHVWVNDGEEAGYSDKSSCANYVLLIRKVVSAEEDVKDLVAEGVVIDRNRHK